MKDAKGHGSAAHQSGVLATMQTGLRNVATRMNQAEPNFKESIMKLGGLTKDEAEKAFQAFKAAKVLVRDNVHGTMTVKHGAFLDRAVLRRAAGIKEGG